MFARQLGAIALAIGIVAGGAAHSVETRRPELAVLVSATDGDWRFESSTMQTVIAAKAHVERGVLDSLQDRSQFVGIAYSTQRER